MEDELLIEILKEWNPWEKEIDAGIRRQRYIDMIYPYLERKEVLVLKGVRRSGKSTIMRQLINELLKDKAEPKQILYVNMEDYRLANDLNLDFLEQILSVGRRYPGNKGKVFLFLDEIQKINDWEKWVRTKYDLGSDIKIVVSGSSASLLSMELSTLLTGRNISFIISPLSYSEFLTFRKQGRIEEYLEYGGFPEVVLEESPEKKTVLLQQYFEDIIYKDIVARHGIRNVKQLMDLARYLISSSGSRVSFNRLSRIFGISKDTIIQYVSFMVNAWLLMEVPYFSFSLKTRHDVTKLPKFYAIDTGILNAVSTKYGRNRGQLYETAALLRLAGDFREISYWSESKSEVDFIVDKSAINVTSTDDVDEREGRGLRDFVAKHRGFSSILVTKSIESGSMVSFENFLKRGIPGI